MGSALLLGIEAFPRSSALPCCPRALQCKQIQCPIYSYSHFYENFFHPCLQFFLRFYCRSRGGQCRSTFLSRKAPNSTERPLSERAQAIILALGNGQIFPSLGVAVKATQAPSARRALYEVPVSFLAWSP